MWGSCRSRVRCTAPDSGRAPLVQVQLFFSDEIPGFVPMPGRGDPAPGDHGGGDAGSGSMGGSANRQDAEDKHARFQASTRREHLGERAFNHPGSCQLALPCPPLLRCCHAKLNFAPDACP